MLWLCLCLSSFMLARSDEIIAADSGAVHSVRCLTRGDVMFYADCTQLQHMRWLQANRVGVRLKGQKGDQEQMGSVHGRTQTEVRGSKPSFRAYGGDVALVWKLMSCFSSLPDHAPLSSYRSGKSGRVVRCGSVFREIKEFVANPVKIPRSSPCTRCVSEERQRSRPEETYRNE